MRLSKFIVSNTEPILLDWVEFARSLGDVTAEMDDPGLRDHAKLILLAVAADMDTPQSHSQQEVKSEGNAPARSTHLSESAATSHGVVRAEEGFSLEQMVSEYRALRASVLRRWATVQTAPNADSFQQLMRFNEAIDEALADSIKTYSLAVEQMFAAKSRRRMQELGTLTAGVGHDMTNVLVPLRASLAMLNHEGATPGLAPAREALRLSIGHLDDLTRGLRSLSTHPDDCAASPEFTRLHEWWTTAMSPFSWALPRGVELHVDGLGSGDPALPPVQIPTHVLMQAVFNFVQNAAQALTRSKVANTTSRRPRRGGNIWISASLQTGMPGPHSSNAVHLTVRDDGPGMDAKTVARCTDAFFTTKAPNLGMGLGLFLVATAIERYGGKVLVDSKIGEGASFTLILPVADAAASKPTTRSSRGRAFQAPPRKSRS